MKYAKCSAVRELPSLNDVYDVFICGSDVIWRSDINTNCSAYFLDFAKKYKFSYGASFGKIVEESMDDKGKIANLLKELDAISCRDRYSIEHVMELSGREAFQVCDPVLLLKKDEWIDIAKNNSFFTRSRRRYIFSYITHDFSEYNMFLKMLKESTGLPLVKSLSGSSTKGLLQHGCFMMKTPQKWLRQLWEADMVITNSFHATLFSVLFHKQYFVMVQGEKNGRHNIRMYDFLKQINQLDHMINTIPASVEVPPTDFEYSDQQIANMREYSFAFLMKNLEAAYRQQKQ